MINDDQIASFNRTGYLVVPNVLTAEQVSTLRASLRSKFTVPEDAASFVRHGPVPD
jgi:ectoine hydroxylase-related dioxygenase (phytanoyl-CoA dioxygenase family)